MFCSAGDELQCKLQSSSGTPGEVSSGSGLKNHRRHRRSLPLLFRAFGRKSRATLARTQSEIVISTDRPRSCLLKADAEKTSSGQRAWRKKPEIDYIYSSSRGQHSISVPSRGERRAAFPLARHYPESSGTNRERDPRNSYLRLEER